MALLWAEQVAERAGMTARSVRWHTSKTRRKLREPGQYGEAGPGDIPLPVGHAMRDVPTKAGGSRRVRSPQYDEAAITAWLAHRLGPGGRPAGEGEQAAVAAG